MLYIFNPKDDITVMELAFIVGHATGYGSALSVSGIHVTDAQWATIPENVKRHFVVSKDEDNSV